MNWFSLIPMALSAMGGIFGGNNTTTATPKQSPELTAAAKDALTQATTNWHKPYVPYTGERVAGPSAQRPLLDQAMSQLGGQINAGLHDANGYQARIRGMLGQGPARVTAPNLVAGGPQAGYSRAPTPMPTLPAPVGM